MRIFEEFPFFKQKTAYEIESSLVGSEMCIRDRLCGAPSSSEALLFFSDDLLCLRLQPVQYDPQHDFAWVADKAYCLVVLALLQVTFLGKCDD